MLGRVQLYECTYVGKDPTTGSPTVTNRLQYISDPTLQGYGSHDSRSDAFCLLSEKCHWLDDRFGYRLKGFNLQRHVILVVNETSPQMNAEMRGKPNTARRTAVVTGVVPNFTSLFQGVNMSVLLYPKSKVHKLDEHEIVNAFPLFDRMAQSPKDHLNLSLNEVISVWCHEDWVGI